MAEKEKEKQIQKEKERIIFSSIDTHFVPNNLKCFDFDLETMCYLPTTIKKLKDQKKFQISNLLTFYEKKMESLHKNTLNKDDSSSTDKLDEDTSEEGESSEYNSSYEDSSNSNEENESEKEKKTEENFTESENYHKAYYSSISALER